MNKNDILAYISDHPGITLGDLHQALGGDYLKLSSRLQTIRREGLIEAHKGESYKGWWIVGQTPKLATNETRTHTTTFKCAHCGATNKAPDVNQAALAVIDSVAAYFNKRGVTHSERKGNEDIAAMADALSDYGYAVNLALHTTTPEAKAPDAS
jgi:hypothetical protein